MEILFAILLGALGWFWWDSDGVKTIVMQAARRACTQANMQLLDATVTLQKIRLQRDHEGRIKLARLYSFEFSGTGADRNDGYIVTLANKIYQLQLNLPDEPPATNHTLH